MNIPYALDKQIIIRYVLLAIMSGGVISAHAQLTLWQKRKPVLRSFIAGGVVASLPFLVSNQVSFNQKCIIGLLAGLTTSFLSYKFLCPASKNKESGAEFLQPELFNNSLNNALGISSETPTEIQNTESTILVVEEKQCYASVPQTIKNTSKNYDNTFVSIGSNATDNQDNSEIFPINHNITDIITQTNSTAINHSNDVDQNQSSLNNIAQQKVKVDDQKNSSDSLLPDKDLNSLFLDYETIKKNQENLFSHLPEAFKNNDVYYDKMIKQYKFIVDYFINETAYLKDLNDYVAHCNNINKDYHIIITIKPLKDINALNEQEVTSFDDMFTLINNNLSDNLNVHLFNGVNIHKRYFENLNILSNQYGMYVNLVNKNQEIVTPHWDRIAEKLVKGTLYYHLDYVCPDHKKDKKPCYEHCTEKLLECVIDNKQMDDNKSEINLIICTNNNNQTTKANAINKIKQVCGEKINVLESVYFNINDINSIDIINKYVTNLTQSGQPRYITLDFCVKNGKLTQAHRTKAFTDKLIGLLCTILQAQNDKKIIYEKTQKTIDNVTSLLNKKIRDAKKLEEIESFLKN